MIIRRPIELRCPGCNGWLGEARLDADGTLVTRTYLRLIPADGAAVLAPEKEEQRHEIPKANSFQYVSFRCGRASCPFCNHAAAVLTTDRLRRALAEAPPDRTGRPWRWSPTDDDRVDAALAPGSTEEDRLAARRRAITEMLKR